MHNLYMQQQHREREAFKDNSDLNIDQTRGGEDSEEQTAGAMTMTTQQKRHHKSPPFPVLSTLEDYVSRAAVRMLRLTLT